jgi:hypothetical protein
MYATVRTYTDSGAFTDTLVANEDALRGVISGISGFRAYYLIRTDTGVTSVSVFDDQSGAEESTRAAAAWVSENATDVSPGAPTVSTGEVALSF